MSRKGSKIRMPSCVKYLLSAGLLCLTMSSLNDSRSSQLSPPSAAWREAIPGYEFSFPRDYGVHPDYRVEWWYYTGNLETKTGRRFGYQLTFFRVGVVREPESASRWALRDLYMAHFAISDIERESFCSFQRINRAGIGWAGADAVAQNGDDHRSVKSALRVWNEDWEARIEGGAHALHAIEEGFSLDLMLKPSKREVVHGEHGISQRGPSLGNASHYYSLTRLESSGHIVADGETFEVTGLSWMDHEFGTSFLEDAQVGWDWFSIQLEDGRDLMLFEIRRRDGTIDEHSCGTLVDADGRAIHLGFEEISLIPADVWRSPSSGASYPIGWKIAVPSYGLRVQVTAAFGNQELRANESTGISYWEGSVAAEGVSGDKAIRGRGYLEMTGYTGQGMGAILR